MVASIGQKLIECDKKQLLLATVSVFLGAFACQGLLNHLIPDKKSRTRELIDTLKMIVKLEQNNSQTKTFSQSSSAQVEAKEEKEKLLKYIKMALEKFDISKKKRATKFILDKLFWSIQWTCVLPLVFCIYSLGYQDSVGLEFED